MTVGGRGAAFGIGTTGARRSTVLVAAVLAVGLVAVSGCGSSGAGADSTTTSNVTTTTARDLTKPRDGYFPQGVEDLAVGNCYDPPPNDAQKTILVMLTNCANAHKYEVYARAEVDLGADSSPDSGYPGDDAVRHFAEERCYQLFRPFVGVQWDASTLNIDTWYPTTGSWSREHDRQVLCVLSDRKAADLTGSMKGTNR